MANVIKRENLCVVVREYKDKNGEPKKVWKTIGDLTTFESEGREFKSMEIYHMPGVKISVFEQEQKTQQTNAPY